MDVARDAGTVWRGRTALVTGASSGIGRALALQLASAGCRVIATARRQEGLDALRRETGHAASVHVIACDLAQPGGATRLADAIREANLEVDLLINNAGVGAAGRFAEMPWERDRQLNQLNVVSTMELTKRLLPSMLARRSGHIVFIGSVVGYMPVPLLAHYSASKAFIRSFAEALSYELRDSGVHVTLVSPGTTATRFFDTAGYRVRLTGGRGIVATPEAVATAVLDAAAAGKRSVVPGLANRIVALAGRLLPTGLLMKIGEKVQRDRL